MDGALLSTFIRESFQFIILVKHKEMLGNGTNGFAAEMRQRLTT